METWLSTRPVVLVLDDAESGNIKDIVGSIDCLGEGTLYTVCVHACGMLIRQHWRRDALLSIQ